MGSASKARADLGFLRQLFELGHGGPAVAKPHTGKDLRCAQVSTSRTMHDLLNRPRILH